MTVAKTDRRSPERQPHTLQLLRRLSALAFLAALAILLAPRLLAYFGLIGPSAQDRIAEAERMLRAAESYGASPDTGPLAAARQELEAARKLNAAGSHREARAAALRAVAQATQAQAAALVREGDAEKRAHEVVEDLDDQVNELEGMFDQVSPDLSREQRSALLKNMREARMSAASVFLAHDEKRFADALAHEQQARGALARTRTALEAVGARRRSPPPSGSPEAEGAAAPPPTGVPVPYEARGACPFECCTYRTWSVERPTEVRSARDAGAAIAFRLAAGEKVEALTGVVVVSRPGRGRAPRDAPVQGMPLRAGDEVAILHPVGEGYWSVWRGGRTANAQVGGPPPAGGRWQAEVEMLEKPVFTWWVQVRDARGRIGWTNRPEDFGGKDRCA